MAPFSGPRAGERAFFEMIDIVHLAQRKEIVVRMHVYELHPSPTIEGRRIVAKGDAAKRRRVLPPFLAIRAWICRVFTVPCSLLNDWPWKLITEALNVKLSGTGPTDLRDVVALALSRSNVHLSSRTLRRGSSS